MDHRADHRRRVAAAVRRLVASGGAEALQAARQVLSVARAAPAVLAPLDAIVVPGFRLADGEPGRGFLERIEAAHRLWWHNRAATLVLSGGTARGELVSEAAAALSMLRDLGLPASVPVLLDPHARNTAQNLRHARELLGARAHGRVAIVSSRFHLARCGVLARQHGLDWQLAGAEPRWRWSVFDALALAREAGALLSETDWRG